MESQKIFVGLDVGADLSTVCVTNADGAVLSEASLPTTCRQISEFIESLYPIKNVTVGLEAGSSSILLTKRLREAGYCVHLFATRQASNFLKIRQNKTDINDARGIADLVRLGRGVVAEVHLKSNASQQLRSQLVLRQKLVSHRVAGESVINSVFRMNGGRLKKSWSSASLQRHVRAELERLRDAEKLDLSLDVEPLLYICIATRRYLENLDRRLSKVAEANPVCARFMEIPGVGPISALSFYSAVDDPTRFRRNCDVGAYLGLVPRVKQSGTAVKRLSISKMGNRLTRSHLAIAAGTMMRQTKIECTLRSWAMNLVPRIGRPKAKTALARKLATVMISMWKTETPFATNPRSIS